MPPRAKASQGSPVGAYTKKHRDRKKHERPDGLRLAKSRELVACAKKATKLAKTQQSAGYEFLRL